MVNVYHGVLKSVQDDSGFLHKTLVWHNGTPHNPRQGPHLFLEFIHWKDPFQWTVTSLGDGIFR